MKSTCYTVAQDLGRLDVDELDDDDPFEIDAKNLPHLFKHLLMDDGRPVVVTIADVRDYYGWGGVLYVEGDPERGPAHWLMVCRVDRGRGDGSNRSGEERRPDEVPADRPFRDDG